jgi:hypothetical protein
MFILKTLQVLCFDMLLHVFILKGLRPRIILQMFILKGFAGKTRDSNKKRQRDAGATGTTARLLKFYYTLAVPHCQE